MSSKSDACFVLFSFQCYCCFGLFGHKDLLTGGEAGRQPAVFVFHGDQRPLSEVDEMTILADVPMSWYKMKSEKTVLVTSCENGCHLSEQIIL